MKRVILAVVAVLSVAVNADAQSTAMAIEKAVLAAPARGSDAATVIAWNSDYTYRTLREGTSQLVCYDQSGTPGEAAFSVACTALGNLDRVAQNRRFAAEGGDRAGTRALVAQSQENGTRIQAVFGSPFLTLSGDDQASAGIHITIATPGATEASTGFPESGRGGGAWIMGAGTSEAHLMTPYVVAP